MATDVLIDRFAQSCPDVDQDVVRDFVSRMDPDYFARFIPDEIVEHIRLVAQLGPDQPCRVGIRETPEHLFKVLVVAYDYFSEFATICGLLSAYRLDIREGRIYTSADAAAPATSKPTGFAPFPGPRRRKPAGLWRNKIVDLFLVQPLSEATFPEDVRLRFSSELMELIAMLDAQHFREARTRVNQRLVETLGRARASSTNLLDPIQIRVDNAESGSDTVLDIRSTDTPAFLYALANALAMRGVQIHRAQVRNLGAEVHDRLFVRDRQGRKLTDSGEQQVLVLTATLIKQFTHFLTWAPDPAKALEHFDLFLDRILEQAKGSRGRQAFAFLKEKRTLTLLAQVLGTSDFLWEDFLRRQHINLVPMLNTYQDLPLVRPRKELIRALRRRLAPSKAPDRRRQILNQFKDQELFRIDMKHLLDTGTTLPTFSRALTELADAVMDQTVTDCRTILTRKHGVPRLADGRPCPFAVFGMGKFGGRELGYASDIEVMFVYGGKGRTNGRRSVDNSEYFERLAHEILQWVEAKQDGIFELDVRLRPHGSKGLLANTVDELRGYYSATGLAAPFERQALIKLRCVVGETVLGHEVEAQRNAFVYSGAPWDLATALDLRRQQTKELVDPGQTNVKYSPGGLIDVEYAVQYLQVMHGHRHKALRTPNTLEALAALTASRILPEEEATALRQAYLFLRGLIDALRIVRGNAKDLVLPNEDSDAFVFLARRMGYTTEDWQEGARKLHADITWHMEWTGQLFGRRFGKV